MKIKSLKFEGLEFGYPEQDLIFNNVDFDFPVNELVWIKASYGTGRSTLLQLLAGLQQSSKGKYLINDENVSEMSFEEFLPYRMNIGYGFDFGGLINNRTLLENLTLPLEYHKICTRKQAEDRVKEYFDVLGASKFLNQRPSNVPGGMRKLSCLVRAMVTHPQMLLLDDPSVGVGQDTLLKYFDLIYKLRKEGLCQHIFISSYDDKFMGLLEHKEIFIDCGQIYSHETDGYKKVVHL